VTFQTSKLRIVYLQSIILKLFLVGLIRNGGIIFDQMGLNLSKILKRSKEDVQTKTIQRKCSVKIVFTKYFRNFKNMHQRFTYNNINNKYADM